MGRRRVEVARIGDSAPVTVVLEEAHTGRVEPDQDIELLSMRASVEVPEHRNPVPLEDRRTLRDRRATKVRIVVTVPRALAIAIEDRIPAGFRAQALSWCIEHCLREHPLDIPAPFRADADSDPGPTTGPTTDPSPSPSAPRAGRSEAPLRIPRLRCQCPVRYTPSAGGLAPASCPCATPVYDPHPFLDPLTRRPYGPRQRGDSPADLRCPVSGRVLTAEELATDRAPIPNPTHTPASCPAPCRGCAGRGATKLAQVIEAANPDPTATHHIRIPPRRSRKNKSRKHTDG